MRDEKNLGNKKFLFLIFYETIRNFNIFLMNYSAQTLMKARLQGANKGHSLLKKKAEALQMRFRIILGKIIEVCDLIFFLIFLM